MLRELFQFIGEQAVAAQAVAVLEAPAEPDHCYLLANRRTGEVEWFDADPAPRAHTAGNVPALTRFVQRVAGEDDANPIVWYNRQGVVLLVDDGTRRDKVTLPLRYSPQMAALVTLETAPARKSFTQGEIVLFLRTVFLGCFDQGLLEALRRVKFRVGDQGEGLVGHGKSSVGRQIESELTGQQTIPEYVTFTVPIFAAGFYATAQVQCAIEILPATQQFQLIPLAGATESAIVQAENQLGQALTEELGDLQVPVLHGNP